MTPRSPDIRFDLLEGVGDWAHETEDPSAAQKLADQARSFVEGFPWSAGVSEQYVGYGLEGVIGIFLVSHIPAQPGVDEWLWVVVGDIPPAYLVTDAVADATEALRTYIQQMREWVEAVRSDEPVRELIPVLSAAGEPLEPSREVADMLETRLRLLEDRVLPDVEDVLRERKTA